jgi:hypothetical protein
VLERANVPGCDDGCEAGEENTDEAFVEQEICPRCAWGRELNYMAVPYLIHYLRLLEAGCPVGRHELTDQEWLILGIIRKEWERLAAPTKEG